MYISCTNKYMYWVYWIRRRKCDLIVVHGLRRPGRGRTRGIHALTSLSCLFAFWEGNWGLLRAIRISGSWHIWRSLCVLCWGEWVIFEWFTAVGKKLKTKCAGTKGVRQRSKYTYRAPRISESGVWNKWDAVWIKFLPQTSPGDGMSWISTNTDEDTILLRWEDKVGDLNCKRCWWRQYNLHEMK